MGAILERINSFVWGVPALVMILGVGIYLSVATGFVQLSLFPKALRSFVRKLQGKDSKGSGVSPFQTLCTALAATVGTGNIAGVAGAIAIGGPGAVFWMWISALFGMVTKFAEATLAVHYQVKDSSGQYTGGPMYMIRRGLGTRFHWLAGLYCFFGVIAAFGVGNATQVNAVLDGLNTALVAFGVQRSRWLDLLLGALLAGLTAVCLLGGARRIGHIAEKLVPFASAAYILLGLGVLLICAEEIPGAFRRIIVGAFFPEAVTGGMIGSALTCLRVGVSRGVFTNEAGMGTASISYASARARHPVEQGLMGIMEVFLDTIVICTITALVILCSGVDIHFGIDRGAQLTAQCYSSVYGQWVNIPIALFLCCFAFATMLGWGLYGARCAQFLFGLKAWKTFVVFQAVIVALSALLETATVWMFAETVNGLMAIPNLISLMALSPVLFVLIKDYNKFNYKTYVFGGTYESFNQRQPLRLFSHEEISSTGSRGGTKWKEDLSFEHRPARH